jgi:hypothetical protein
VLSSRWRGVAVVLLVKPEPASPAMRGSTLTHICTPTRSSSTSVECSTLLLLIEHPDAGARYGGRLGEDGTGPGEASRSARRLPKGEQQTFGLVEFGAGAHLAVEGDGGCQLLLGVGSHAHGQQFAGAH